MLSMVVYGVTLCGRMSKSGLLCVCTGSSLVIGLLYAHRFFEALVCTLFAVFFAAVLDVCSVCGCW